MKSPHGFQNFELCEKDDSDSDFNLNHRVSELAHLLRLGNHEFDHSIETLGQRLLEIDAEVINSNIFSCSEHSPNPAAFLDALPRHAEVNVGGMRLGLMGMCTTTTPLSSAKKPKGVLFGEVVPLARQIVVRRCRLTSG